MIAVSVPLEAYFMPNVERKNIEEKVSRSLIEVKDKDSTPLVHERGKNNCSFESMSANRSLKTFREKCEGCF